MGSEESEERVLRNVDASRRAFLKKLILGSAFVVPVVASFTMGSLDAEKASAYPSNQTYYYTPGIPGEENCYGQTIAFLEHIPAEEFQYFVAQLASDLEPYNLTPAHGIGSLANQWCRYGAITEPKQP